MRLAIPVAILGMLASAPFPISLQAAETAGVLPSWWKSGLPSIAIPGEFNSVDPVALQAESGALLLAAESHGPDGSAIWLSRSIDGGRTWESPHEIACAREGYRMTAGAAGTLSGGGLALALHEWKEAPGQVTHIRENPAGVHHYSWTGFTCSSELRVLVSQDEGASWTTATTDMNAGPMAAFATGKAFSGNGADWFPVYGPSSREEMEAALSSVGLVKSIDGGTTWRFSHWVAIADREQNVGYGPGDVTVLPDGRWLAMLQGNYRGLGEFTRPRVCRTISLDNGSTWSAPTQELLNHGCSTVVLEGDEIMVGGWKDRGIMFTVGANAGEDWLYQDQVWWCIWYGEGKRGGTRLLKLADSVLVVYHWMDKAAPTRTEVRSQILRRCDGQAERIAARNDHVELPKWKWEMAEAYQVPDIPEAPAGLRIKSLLKLKRGDWMCLGYIGSRIAGTAYGFAPTGFCVLKSANVEGPWKKVSDLPTPSEAGGQFDTGTGAGLPGVMVQLSSGRLLLPFSAKDRKDIILTYSDDEGGNWNTIGSMASITGLPAVLEADKIVEREDGSLIFPMQRAFNASTGQHPLFYVRSSDQGLSWSAPVFWATHPGTRYEGLPHGPLGDLRETGLAVLSEKRWLGIYRESRGATAPENAEQGPLSMPFLCLGRSDDDGRTWKSSFGFLGVEPDIAALPGGAVMVAYRDDNLASVWLSYDRGSTWEVQQDPAELPWRSAAAEAHGQWPPGGEPIIRVLDENTVAVICDTGMIPSGKLLPAEYKGSKEMHGRVQVRYFRRVPEVVGVEESERKVQRLATPSGIRFAILGEKPTVPAPTLFVFARGDEETLIDLNFNMAGHNLARSGYLSVSIDVPCHGEDQRPGEPGGLDGWRKRVENGQPLLKEFLANGSAVLEHLIREGYTDPARVAACGNSRGGFMALHFAAAEPRVRCVAAIAPVTTLPPLREFKGLEDHAGTQSLAAINIADKLAGRAVWLCIGNSDDRVNTDDAIAFTRAVVKASAPSKTPIPVELHVMPVLGHSQHDTAQEEVAEWVIKQFGDHK